MSDIDTGERHPREETADDVFRAWERLRIVYNVVLAIGTIPFLIKFIDVQQFTIEILACAIGANLCFCAGPVAEGYAAAVGLERRTARWVIFVLGVGLSLIIEFCILLGIGFEQMD